MDERDERNGIDRTEQRANGAALDPYSAPVHLDGEELTRAGLIALMKGRSNSPSYGRPAIWHLGADAITMGIERCAPDSLGRDDRSELPRISSEDASRLLSANDPRARVTNPRPIEIPDAGIVTIENLTGARLLVDLVAAGVTSVSGEILDRKAYLRQCIDELADRRWSPLATVIVVGASTCSDERLTLGGLTIVDDFAALEEWRSTVDEPERRIRPATTKRSRATVVIVGAVAIGDREGIRRLCATRAHGNDEIAVLIGGPWPGARCTLVLESGTLRADAYVRVPAPELASARPDMATPNPVNAASHLERSDEGDRDPMPRLFDSVSALAAPPDQDDRRGDEDHPSNANGPLFFRRRGDPGARLAEPVESQEIEVAVLGRIEIRGVDGSLDRRPKLTELVVYLALHPGGSTTDAWTTALWPGRQVPLQTIANRLSEARGLLGYASDGRPRLRRSGELHLVAEVTTDWTRFRELAAPSASLESWRAALELVRGRPFEDLSSNLWTAIECTAVAMEQAVIECALRVGEQLLQLGDPTGASAAAHRGLRASPWDEPLHRLLMIAADATGNRAGVEAILRHLALVLEVEGDPLRHVHPETAELYARLVAPRHSIRV